MTAGPKRTHNSFNSLSEAQGLEERGALSPPRARQANVRDLWRGLGALGVYVLAVRRLPPRPLFLADLPELGRRRTERVGTGRRAAPSPALLVSSQIDGLGGNLNTKVTKGASSRSMQGDQNPPKAHVNALQKCPSLPLRRRRPLASSPWVHSCF